ncbi:MAG: DNA-binding response regulator [Candidatus Pacebacteria bacterium CG10_big_fil_rev_8_21_14_0_10_36_11]|nr:response regulator transcription factor [Candidatus Pacearchaeota archaeon]OIP73574.1 MAG: DNA-binding response regulator [Candidatus Pacebacteria bacterium CG2_30_36_39]PIR64845.1 MAG: DNA-binding response regulator [Candidatus Pacebacteria bacterium CG10_big_fil_rev_8_21_14_0_10_36_11]PJC42462.1 MAG: DNA-binding response regulator [Candidatus Pacebacteria bacterium CG_4_9_14_0_2_um_filter_36_8]
MKILVIEDEKRIADSIRKGFELKSLVVDVAYDGQTGLDFALNEKYDVIVLDRMLPGFDGLYICQQLRKEKNHTPILMLTAKTEVVDRVEGLDNGADDYLGKPFSFIELLARVRALARRPSQVENSSLLSEDSLTLNTKTYEVSRTGQLVSLSKKEFSLLEFLLRNKGQVFTKEQLTERVWSFESDILPNTAQVYLGYLRNKIDKDFPKEKPLINTSRGFGYRFGISEKKR